MKKVLFTLLLFPLICFSQDFGCYDLKSVENYSLDGIFIREGSIYNLSNKIEWTQFTLDSNILDGYFKKLYYNKSYCTEEVKMEGFIKNGLREGIWKLYLNKSIFFIGRFNQGKKEGLWTSYYIDEEGDSIITSKIEFINDLYEGTSRFYYLNGQLQKKINYQNGIKNGQEIEYFENDTNNVIYIEELKEYSNGILNGKYLNYKYNNPSDTSIYGIYSGGKKNSRFLFYQYDKSKIIIDYVNDQVDGKVLKYYSNGILAFELDYKNNLPYNLIQMKDTSGFIIESNSLVKGNGILNLYYSNGKLFSSAEYKNQLISGKVSRYYESGKLWEEGLIYSSHEKTYKKSKPIEQYDDLNLFSCWQLNFIKGTNYLAQDEDGSQLTKINSIFNDSIGEYIIIYENYYGDNFLSKEFLWRGLKFGKTHYYFNNGILKKSVNFSVINYDTIKISVKDGIFKYYHLNGNLKAKIHYSNDIEVGSSYFYDDSGNLIRKKVINLDGGIYNIFNNDTVNRLDKYNRKQGKWISLPTSFSADDCYYIPNQIKFYKNDNPAGVWEYYSLLGEYLIERFVWQDSINSNYQMWTDGGNLIEEGKMIDETKNGEWKIYDSRKGYLKFNGLYKCGKREGIWQEFKKNGKIISEVEYVEGKIKNVN